MSQTYVVAVYDCDRAFGGHEEGGWWYDFGKLVRIVKTVRNEEQAYEYSRRLNRRLQSRAFGPNVGKRDIGSVLSEGELQSHVYENLPPSRFPESIPHYE